MSILWQGVRSTRALLEPTALPVVQKREARATAVNFHGQLGGTHQGQGSNRKEGKAPKPGLSRRDHSQTGNHAPRLTRALERRLWFVIISAKLELSRHPYPSLPRSSR